MPAFLADHHNPIVNQEKRDDQNAQQDAIHRNQHGQGVERADRDDIEQERRGQRQEQGIAVAVPASVFSE